jgi:hypothetical protein
MRVAGRRQLVSLELTGIEYLNSRFALPPGVVISSTSTWPLRGVARSIAHAHAA